MTDIGYASSPMVYFAACKLDIDAGANITASHNPKQYNGVKLVAKMLIPFAAMKYRKF